MPRFFIGTGGSVTPGEVLAALHRRAAALGIPPPAAVAGDWLDVRAVIAPSVDIVDVPVADFMSGPRPAAPAHQDRDGVRVGGCWFGCLYYPESVDAVPVARQGWTDDVVVLDEDGWWYESHGNGGAFADIARSIAEPRTPAEALPWQVNWTAPDRAHHEQSVHDCLEAIRAGEIYQACVVTQFHGVLDGAAVGLFCDLYQRTRPAKAAYLSGSWGAIASFSPELFLRRSGRRVRSRPIKGTVPRHVEPAVLQRSVKDVAENVMIVDLVRNDLGKVAEIGSIRVPDLLRIEEAPAVWHLVSTVTATVDPAIGNAEVINAAFPPASVTGTPKRRAQQLTGTWEPVHRGIYCGTVGICSPVAGLELNVAIRTIEITGDGLCTLGVGGGITADSRPDSEWDECMVKASSIVNCDARR